MKKILAVSGGIDSMVMLHLFRNDKDAVVAHFDHGIRRESADDCAFVARIAKEYGCPFFSKRAELGETCSEESARQSRYAFLRQLSDELGGKIYTAHHMNDVIETIAINFLRGTGWRGLAPFSDIKVERPLLDWEKSRIYQYATENQVRFRADSTNTDDKYLRNRIRHKLAETDVPKTELFKLFEKQRELRREIESLETDIIDNQRRLARELFTICDDVCGAELLRELLNAFNVSLTRPQLERALDAIRNYLPNKRFSLDARHFLQIDRYYFTVTEV